MNNIANFTLRAGMGVALLFSMTGTVLAAPGDAALGDGLFARISTSMGDIVVRLEYEKTPITVCNFTALAEGKMTAARGKPFYNGLIFHRVIAGFMIQGGDPLGTGMGGPGYRFADEFDPSLRHDGPGVLSMANAGPGTNGSQFFITLAATPHLDGRHTVFGRVVKGLDVLQAIGGVRTGPNDKPLTPVTMRNVAIVRNGAGANAFKADQAAFDALIGNIAAAEEAKLAAKRDADLALIEQKFPGAELKPSGLRWIIQKAGAGAKPAPGSSAMVNFKGMFLNGESFDNSDLAGGAVEFPVGVGRLLPGLDETIMDMAPGEKRTAIIPPELAFGNRWVEDVIPPNSFLVYEIELVRIK